MRFKHLAGVVERDKNPEFVLPAISHRRFVILASDRRLVTEKPALTLLPFRV